MTGSSCSKQEATDGDRDALTRRHAEAGATRYADGLTAHERADARLDGMPPDDLCHQPMLACTSHHESYVGECQPPSPDHSHRGPLGRPCRAGEAPARLMVRW